MWIDPIVAELHRTRERHARQFGYDLRRLFYDLKQEQTASGRRVVSLPRQRRKNLLAPSREKKKGSGGRESFPKR